MSIEVRAYLESQIAGCRNVITELENALDHHRRQQTMLTELLAQVPAPTPPVHTSLPFTMRPCDCGVVCQGRNWDEGIRCKRGSEGP